jgi:hypothetical protein
MGKPTYYRAIFKTPDDKYYSKFIPEPCAHWQDAEREMLKLKRKEKIKDAFVTLEWSEEDQFL